MKLFPSENHRVEADEPLLDLERFLPYRLSVLSNRVSGEIARLYQERFGLSIAEWRAIAVLGRFGAMSANGVADRTAMDKVRVSRAVARLLEAGRINRQVDADDRRRSVLALSPAGRAIYADIAPLALAVEARLLAALDDGDRVALERVLSRLEGVAATPFAQASED